MIYFIEAGNATIQAAETLPKGAQQVDNWRTMSIVRIHEIAANLSGESVLELDVKPIKAAKPKAEK